MKMAKYRAWGNYSQQTVRKNKDGQNLFIIRQSNNRISLKKNEIDSLIVALLEVRK